MNIYRQIEDHFEEFEREFDIFCGIKITDNLGESKYSKNLKHR